MIRRAAVLIGGKGGRPTMARAGGKDAAGLDDAVALAEKTIIEALALKVLALDYGSARTGVAVSDATGTLARPWGSSSGRARRRACAGSPRSSRRREPSASSSACH